MANARVCKTRFDLGSIPSRASKQLGSSSPSESVKLWAKNFGVVADWFDSTDGSPNNAEAEHWRVQVAVTHPRLLWRFDSVPLHQLFRVDYDEAGCGYRMSVKARRYRDNARAALVAE